MPLYSIETHGRLTPHLNQEWLVTNGLGGFAGSTLIGCNTRRYHGLLCAATLPPVGRIMALNRIGEMLLVGQTLHEFSSNQFGDNFHPRGDQFLHFFELDADGVARWKYDVAGTRIIKELQMVWMKNTVGVRYTIDPEPNQKVQLRLQPFVTLRDFHTLLKADGTTFGVKPDLCSVAIQRDDHTLYLQADQGAFVHQEEWWHQHTLSIEAERGMDNAEDLMAPGHFVLDTDRKITLTLWASLDKISIPDWDQVRAKRPDPCVPARASASCASPTLPIKKLLHAAADFIAYRKAPDGTDGDTIIAGYPWFSDWGRDTMISLPGILLVTGRFEIARKVLTVFAEYVSEGMIPNRFDDYNNEPHYNTVDASLWFIHACFEYLKASKDQKNFDAKLLPACREIIRGYRQGTRYKIGMDPNDGLIHQGDEHTQLTWMDAKCGDTSFTPRQGKPVEINALWYHALMLMNEKELAAKVAESFRREFWISPFRGLCDVVNADQRDMSIRPNQIFAVSLENSPLTDEQKSAVVEVVRRELLTPVGLRSLSKDDPKYHGQYSGDQWHRDQAYHNGTVWCWPIGAFLEAYLRVNKHSDSAKAQARQWLQPLINHMESDDCIGQISEIFEGDAPHRAVGCYAQAWSVAEVLRLAVELGM